MKTSDLSDSFQIPKFEAQAEIFLADNRSFKGILYLSILPSSPLGHITVVDWLNEANVFFPVMRVGEKRTEILNKMSVVQLVVDNKLNLEYEELVEEPLDISADVMISSHPYFTVEGRIYLNMPPAQSRVLDFLNQSQQFFPLHNGERCHIINKRFVTGVMETANTSAQTLEPTELILETAESVVSPPPAKKKRGSSTRRKTKANQG